MLGSPPEALGISNEKRFTDKIEGFQFDLGIPPTDQIPIIHESSSFFITLLAALIPMAIMGILLLTLRGGASSGMGGVRRTIVSDSH